MINKNQSRIDPHVAKWVTHVHELVTSPALPQTVTTTYCVLFSIDIRTNWKVD